MNDLDDIIDDTPVETPEQEAAAEVAEQEPVEATEVTPEEPPVVPEVVAEVPQQSESEKALLGVVTALRHEIRDMKSQQAPAPTPLPDVLDDQAGFTQSLEQRMTAQLQNERLNTSEAIARRDYGSEKVDAALQALEASGDPAAQQAILSKPLPYDALVKWHEGRQFAQKVGDDPAAYEARIREEARAQAIAEMEAKQTAASVGTAPSLAAQTSIGGRNSAVAPTLTPLDDLLP